MVSVARLVLAGLVVSGIVIYLVCRSKRPAEKRTGTSAAQRHGDRSSRHASDAGIGMRLSVELKSRLAACRKTWPPVLTGAWLQNDVFGEVCLGDAALYQSFLEDIVRASDGEFRFAAKIGEVIDPTRMDPGRELPPGYVVCGLVYAGLVRATTAEVLVKAKVI